MSSSLLEDFDTQTVPPADGEVLMFDAASGKWENKQLSTQSLSDFSSTPASTGDFLAWDGQ